MSNITQRLSASQTQSLGQTLSPQMQRTMQLLQLSRDELESEITEICEANPLIADPPAWSRGISRPNDLLDWTASAASRVSLVEHLTQQLALSNASRPVKAMAISIIQHVAPDGRLSIEDWDGLASKPHATAALCLVQRFEPAGVGARSLSECFALQLDAALAACPGWQALLANLDAMATDPASALAKRCDISETVLSSMIAHLRTLDPYPGHQFETAEPIEITPDLRAERCESGEWTVGLTWDPGSSIATEPAYRGWQGDESLAKPAKLFLATKQDEADWLRRALKQRGQTLLRVTRFAIAFQHRFLDDGPEHLAPLTMREIAAKLDLHESTISRAVANKYILTPRGVLPMRSFFSTALSDDLEHIQTSSAAVRARIGKIIDDEPTPGEMSDMAISNTLKKSGVTIARRSVAKHREQLGLGSARERARMATYAVAAE